jgi:homoserine kinase
MIEVKVPATSANLGPGYDCLGLALGLYNKFYFYEDEKEEKTFKEDNLVFQAAKKVYDLKGKDISKLRFKIETHVPIARGMGSSSTCIIGGILGANELINANLSEEEIINLATEIEGHPDNVLPAYLGGCVFSNMEGKKVSYQKIEGLEKVKTYIAIPDFELKTSLSRKVVPKTVSLEDAVTNMRNLFTLLEGLRKSDLDLICRGAVDRLHEPYRYKLIPGYEKIKEIENYFKGRLVISGAGPSLLFITDDSFESKKVLEKLVELSKETDHKRDIRLLPIDTEGAKVYKK